MLNFKYIGSKVEKSLKNFFMRLISNFNKISLMQNSVTFSVHCWVLPRWGQRAAVGELSVCTWMQSMTPHAQRDGIVGRDICL